MQNVADIFAAWPSDADLARDIGLSYPTVASWKQRGSIPVAYWRPIILAACKRRHPEITASLLLELHSRSSDRGGFAEADGTYEAQAEIGADTHGDEPRSKATGHFSRHKHIRRNRYRTAEEIEEHIQALREEWSHR
jgi:hypothetical protein